MRDGLRMQWRDLFSHERFFVTWSGKEWKESAYEDPHVKMLDSAEEEV